MILASGWFYFQGVWAEAFGAGFVFEVNKALVNFTWLGELLFSIFCLIISLENSWKNPNLLNNVFNFPQRNLETRSNEILVPRKLGRNSLKGNRRVIMTTVTVFK